MAIERRGQSYRVRYVGPDGRRRSRSFHGRVDGRSAQQRAREFDALWRVERRRDPLVDFDAGDELLGEFAPLWLAEWSLGKAEKTIRDRKRVYNTHVLPALGAYPLNQLSPRVIEQWREAMLAAGVGRESARKAMMIVSQIMDRAVVHGLVRLNPCLRVRKPSQPERSAVVVPSLDQVEAVRAELLRRGDVKSALIVSCFAYAMLRPGELMALDRGDVQLERGLISVSKRVSLGEVLQGAKSRRARRRSVPLLAPLAADLDDYLSAGSPTSGSVPLLLAPQAERWTEGVYRAWKARVYRPLAREHKLPAANPYLLRHLGVSLLLAGGIGLAEIAQRAGHSLTVLTDVYGHMIEQFAGRPRIDPEAEIAAARERHGMVRLAPPPELYAAYEG